MAYDPKSSGAAVTEEVAAINPNDQYWQTGLKAFNNGEPTTSAINDIWATMFPASLDLVAQIVGALYGDTYFDSDSMQMSVSQLSADLSAATGKNKPDCDRSAQKAFSRWYGLSVRANFQDGAVIPRQGGNLFSSPDVVLNGRTALTPQQLIQAWNQTVWGPISGDRNVAYGRAGSVNLPLPITQPVLKMYTVDGSINPPNPQSWTQLFTRDNSNRESPLVNQSNSSTLAPGDRAANSDAFVWTVPGSGHYCVISVAGSEYFTNDPSQIPPGNWSSTAWITYNGAAGWHNYDTPQGNTAVLKIHNLDPTPERFTIEAVASGLEPGTEVSLELADLGVRGNAMRVTGARDAVTTLQVELPGNYTGDVLVTFKTPDGGPIPEKGVIDVRSYWVVPPGHVRYEAAVDRVGDTRAFALQRHVSLYNGNFTLVGKL